MSTERIVAVQPPVPLTTDARASRACCPEPLRELLRSSPVIGVVLLRLGRYAIGVLRGDKLIATKTDSRYMKNRHRAGGQSQRRFARSRERLIRELYDKTCEVTRADIRALHRRDGTRDAWRRARHARRVREALPPDAGVWSRKRCRGSSQYSGQTRGRSKASHTRSGRAG